MKNQWKILVKEINSKLCASHVLNCDEKDPLVDDFVYSQLSSQWFVYNCLHVHY